MKTVKVLLPDALGDRMMFRNVFRAAQASGVQLEVYGRASRAFADRLVTAQNKDLVINHIDEPPEGVIDLYRYSARPMHPLTMTKHLIGFQLDLINQFTDVRIGFAGKDLAPTLGIGDTSEVEKSLPKNLVVLFTTATSPNRNPTPAFWKKLTDALRGNHKIIQIRSNGEIGFDFIEQQTIDEPILIPPFIKAVERAGGYVITVDSFPLHAAGAVGCERTLLLATSSNPQAVIYPGMKYIATGCTIGARQFICGLHGYGQHVGEIKDNMGIEVQEFKDEKGGCRSDLVAAGQKYACTSAMDVRIEEIVRIVKQQFSSP